MFDSDLFDATFGGLVAANAEGGVIASQGASGAPGLPFTSEAVGQFAGGAEQMQAPGAAVL